MLLSFTRKIIVPQKTKTDQDNNTKNLNTVVKPEDSIEFRTDVGLIMIGAFILCLELASCVMHKIFG